jgi:hypothetical protein
MGINSCDYNTIIFRHTLKGKKGKGKVVPVLNELSTMP